MGYFEKIYKNIMKDGSNAEYNPDLEGGDYFKIAGYDPTGHFADIRVTGTIGHVYHNSGNFYLRVRPTGT